MLFALLALPAHAQLDGGTYGLTLIEVHSAGNLVGVVFVAAGEEHWVVDEALFSATDLTLAESVDPAATLAWEPADPVSFDHPGTPEWLPLHEVPPPAHPGVLLSDGAGTFLHLSNEALAWVVPTEDNVSLPITLTLSTEMPAGGFAWTGGVE